MSPQEIMSLPVAPLGDGSPRCITCATAKVPPADVDWSLATAPVMAIDEQQPALCVCPTCGAKAQTPAILAVAILATQRAGGERCSTPAALTCAAEVAEEHAARAAKELAVERGLRETAERMCKRMQDERNAAYDGHVLGKLADELDEGNYASAAKALREAIFMLDKAARRDAAWARLVKAVEVRWREDFLGAAQCDYQREIEAAKDALRALGVDEDLLRLGEP